MFGWMSHRVDSERLLIRMSISTYVRQQWRHEQDPAAEQSITSFKDGHWNKDVNTPASRMWKQTEFKDILTMQILN